MRYIRPPTILMVIIGSFLMFTGFTSFITSNTVGDGNSDTDYTSSPIYFFTVRGGSLKIPDLSNVKPGLDQNNVTKLSNSAPLEFKCNLINREYDEKTGIWVLLSMNSMDMPGKEVHVEINFDYDNDDNTDVNIYFPPYVTVATFAVENYTFKPNDQTGSFKNFRGTDDSNDGSPSGGTVAVKVWRTDAQDDSDLIIFCGAYNRCSRISIPYYKYTSDNNNLEKENDISWPKEEDSDGYHQISDLTFRFETVKGEPHPEWVTNALKEKVVLIVFTQEKGTGCAGCDKMHPIIEQLKDEYKGSVEFIIVYMLQNDEREDAYSIYVDDVVRVPTFIIVTMGKEDGTLKPCYAEFAGIIDYDTMETYLRDAIGIYEYYTKKEESSSAILVFFIIGGIIFIGISITIILLIVKWKKRSKRGPMFCINCDNELIEGKKYCIHCGKKIEGYRNEKNV